MCWHIRADSILPRCCLWIKEKYGAEVICFCADVGQGDELDGLEEKALKTGASKLYVEDLREEFVKEFVWTAVKANALYEGVYLLGTSLARPVIAQKTNRNRAKRRRGRGGARRDGKRQRSGAF